MALFPRKTLVFLLILPILLLSACEETHFFIANTQVNNNITNITDSSLWYNYTYPGPGFYFARTNMSVWMNNSVDIYGFLTQYGETMFLGMVQLNNVINQNSLTGNNEWNRPSYGPHWCDNSGSGDGRCLNDTQKRVNGTCASGSSIRAIGLLGNVTCELDSTGADNYVQSISITENGDVHNITLDRGEDLVHIWASFIDNNTQFDQNLNTTDSVVFKDLTIQNLTINNTLKRFTIIEHEHLQAYSTNTYTPFVGWKWGAGASVAGTGNSSHPGVTYFQDGTTNPSGFSWLTDIIAFRLSGDEQATFIFNVNNNRMTTWSKFGFFDSQTSGVAVDGCFFAINKKNLTGSCVNNSISVNTTRYVITSYTWYTGIMTINSAATNVTFSLYASPRGALLWNRTISTRIPTREGRETGFGMQAWETSTDSAAPIISFDYTKLDIKRNLNR